MKIKLIELSAFAAFVIVVAMSIFSFESDCQGVRDKVLRLHVIANSNTSEDQQLKLTVRDEILKKSADIFSGSTDKDSAEKAAREKLSELQCFAEKVIADNGFDYPVKIEIGKSRFPTKTYEDITLPAGEYDAVRIIIGAGSGKNWWCVLFPVLCLPAATDDKQISDVLNEQELELVRSDPKYEIRFWIIEKIDQLRNTAQSKKDSQSSK